MTSPRQRKKYAAFLRQKEQEVKATVAVAKPAEPVKAQPPVVVQKVEQTVAVAQPAVVESVPAAKAKKQKSSLVEEKSQDQVVEQPKEEVKTSTGE